MCWHSFIKQSHITTTPSRASSFAAIFKFPRTSSFAAILKFPAQVHLPPFWNSPHKFICRHFEIDCLVHLCGTAWTVSFNRWIRFRCLNRVNQPGGGDPFKRAFTWKMFTKLTHSGCAYVICFSVHMLHLESYVFNVFRRNLITREAFVFGEHPKPKNNHICRGFKWLPFNLVSGSAIVLIEPSDPHTNLRTKEHHPYYQSLLCANAWTTRD